MSVSLALIGGWSCVALARLHGRTYSQPTIPSIEAPHTGSNDLAVNTRMTHINIKLTPSELELLTTLASDQLFRREFVEPKMPGHKSNSGEIKRGKVLVSRMRSLLNPDDARRTRPARKAERDAV